jgi:hypothetical protein
MASTLARSPRWKAISRATSSTASLSSPSNPHRVRYVPGEQVAAIYPGEVTLKIASADIGTLEPFQAPPHEVASGKGASRDSDGRTGYGESARAIFGATSITEPESTASSFGAGSRSSGSLLADHDRNLDLAGTTYVCDPTLPTRHHCGMECLPLLPARIEAESQNAREKARPGVTPRSGGP